MNLWSMLPAPGTLASAMINLQMVLSVAAICGLLAHGLIRRQGHPKLIGMAVVGQWWLLGLSLIVPFVSPWLTPDPWLVARTETWAATTWKNFDQAVPQVTISTPFHGDALTPISMHWPLWIIAGVLLWSAWVIWQLGRDAYRLWHLKRNSYSCHRIGGVDVRISDVVPTPLAWRGPRQLTVMLPSQLLPTPQLMLVALRHELMHHRLGHTGRAWLLAALKLLAGFNPLVMHWLRSISTLEELQCDDAMIRRKGMTPKEYGQSLLQVAMTASVHQAALPAGTTGMASSSAHRFLKWRLETMLVNPAKPVRRGLLTATVCLASIFVVTTALASRHEVHDRTITLDQAQGLVQELSSEQSEFPMPMNDRVLRELNRFAGTPDGREYMRGAIERMHSYQEMLNRVFDYHRVPAELRAVAIAESAFRNLPEHLNPVQSAGIWQIIPSTGRRLGLRVDQEVDERMVPELATDAAIRYLLLNYRRFDDWHLSLLSYYRGENLVARAIDQLNSRDVWTIIAAGYQGSTPYVSRVIAMAILLHHPELVQN